MYDILDLYAEEYNPSLPVICLDEKPKQLLKDVREPIAIRPGRPEKADYEYKRNGNANIFVAVEPKGGRRIAEVTERRCKADYARFIKRIVDNYPAASVIRIVQDNLNTHKENSIIEAFGEKEARRILDRIEFHYTPKHASWLNMAEIEIGVMDNQCTARRIGDISKLRQAVHSWSERRNSEQRKINWKFTRGDADIKLGKHYVTLLSG